MRSSFTLAAASLLASVSLASDQIPIYFPGVATSYVISASVSTANPTSTILVMPCPTSGANDLLANEVCPSSGLTYSIISTTVYQATIGPDVAFTCVHKTASKEMSCNFVADGVSAPGQTYTEGDFQFITASITAGAESLSGIQTGSAASATPASSGTAQASGTKATGSAATATPTGAAFKYGIEGSALLALAGAAALNAW
jgi:hypothetical protein